MKTMLHKRNRNRNRTIRRARGFTLIEMIAVIALIAAIAALVGGKIISNQKRAQWNLAKTQMQNLANEVDQYQGDVGRYPERLWTASRSRRFPILPMSGTASAIDGTHRFVDSSHWPCTIVRNSVPGRCQHGRLTVSGLAPG